MNLKNFFFLDKIGKIIIYEEGLKSHLLLTFLNKAWFGFFNGISTFVGNLLPQPSMKKNCSDTI